MNCVKCGAEIPYRTGACPKCGLKVTKMEALAQKIALKADEKSNPFRWTLRDWLTILAVIVFSGVIFSIVSESVVMGMMLGFLAGCLFFVEFYCESLRYIIWRDLRIKAMDKDNVKVSFIKRISKWFMSDEGAYQRMAGYWAVITCSGALELALISLSFDKFPKTVFQVLALLGVVVGGIGVVRIGITWEHPVSYFKRWYEWLAILVIGVINGIILTTSSKVFEQGMKVFFVYEVCFLCGGMLVAIYVYGENIKRLIRNKGFHTPRLRPG